MTDAYCAPRPPSPYILPTSVLHSNGSIARLTTSTPNREYTPTLVPWCVAAQFCSAQRSGRGGYIPSPKYIPQPLLL